MGSSFEFIARRDRIPFIPGSAGGTLQLMVRSPDGGARTMNLRLSLGFLLIPLMGAWGADTGSAGQEANPASGPMIRGQRLFSTGHSFHFGFAPILDEMAKSAGFADNTIVGISSIGGSRVVQHWAGKAVQAALTAGTVDVLTTTPIYLPDPGIEQVARLG